MNLQSRLKKLERLKLKTIVDKDCICFPADEPPCLYLEAERESAKAVLCPVHGPRFSKFDCTIFHAISKPAHPRPEQWTWRSKQYRKAMEATFPPDRWPATEILGPGPVIRYVLKNGIEICRIHLEPIYDYATNLPIFENGKQLFAGPPGKTIFVEPA